LKCWDEHGQLSQVSYSALDISTNRLANVLGRIGVGKGDRVAALLGNVPELAITVLGTLKAGAVFTDLACEADDLEQRLRLVDPRALVTNTELYKRRVAPMREQLPSLAQVLLIDGPAGADTLDFHRALAESSEDFVIPPTEPDDPSLVLFTRGRAGKPRAVVHVHESVIAHHATAAYALDLHAGDVVWCDAEQPSLVKICYGIMAALSHATTSVLDVSRPDPADAYALLEQAKVTVWYTTPATLRLMRQAGAALAQSYDLSSLRFVASVGESLEPDLVTWSQEALGRPAHDTWCQTETGIIAISNYASMDIRPGSMGKPMPGVRVGLLPRGAADQLRAQDGDPAELTDPNAVGEIAIRPSLPSMFRAYLDDAEEFARRFVGGWYFTGDLARRDNDGFYWHAGRLTDR
jgi:acetyl-CoA synthetase